jgi:hypothetical protein
MRSTHQSRVSAGSVSVLRREFFIVTYRAELPSEGALCRRQARVDRPREDDRERAEDVAEIALLFAAFPSNALTGHQSPVVSHGGFMQ